MGSKDRCNGRNRPSSRRHGCLRGSFLFPLRLDFRALAMQCSAAASGITAVDLIPERR